MSQCVIQIMVACLAVCCIISFVQIWQLKEQLNQQHNELKQFKLAVSGELQAINERAQRQYDILYEKVRKNRKDAREDAGNILSLLTDLTDNIKVIKDKYEIDVARLDEKVDANDKRVNEEIGENQRKMNNSIRGVAELFLNEITKLENETLLIREKVKQLEAISREPVMIENKVHVETEYHHHHHHQVVESREPTLGERIGQFIGGVLQTGATYLLSKAIGLQ